ncbi:Croquemort protein [Globisporangium polare]
MAGGGVVGTPGSANDTYEKNVSTPDVIGKNAHGPNKRSGGGCSPLAVARTLLVTGALLVVIAIVYGTVLPTVINKKIKTGVVVCSAADAKEDFYDPYGDCKDCTPYYYTMRMFNVTNAEAFLNSGAKLALQETGPYVYRRRQIKVDVTFDTNNNRVSYKQYTYHTFEPSMSCSGCAEQDEFVSFDVGYLSVLGSAGGEFGFLTSLVKGTFGSTMTDAELADIVQKNGTQMMRWVNGLNSLDPVAMKNVGSTVAAFLLTGVNAIAKLSLEGFAYNGLLVKRTAKQWALGYPSMLAGLGLGSTYVNECTVGGVLAKCNSCSGDACLDIWAECKQCQLASRVVAANNVTCGIIEDIMTKSYNATQGKAFASNTCGLCTAVGLCAAPLPGIAEDSGMDWSKTAPPSDTLGTYIQRTGCDNLSAIGEYEQYNGDKAIALWAKLDSRRNPTLAELAAFSKYGNCANPTANMTCSQVHGADAQSLKPGGASIKGFASSVEQRTASMYLDQGKQEISLLNLDEEFKYEGIPLHRFGPATDLLTSSSVNQAKGTGYPVDGVQPMSFTTGFLAYVSYPLFLYGDKSLLDAIDVTLEDGKTLAKQSAMYEDSTDAKTLKTEFADKYVTFLDVEAGTGKTMRARKRLMASYALSKSALNASAAMTDVLWPNLPTEVIVPSYWGEESATVGKSQIDEYSSIKTLLGSLLPVLIAGIIVGLALAAWGFVRRRNALASYQEVSGSVI